MEPAYHIGERFLRVLQELGMDARDSLVCWIQGNREDGGEDLRAMRASCRALRDLVDGSMTDVKLAVRNGDQALWNEGSRPPLHRWPRCSDVKILLDDAELLETNPVLAGDLLALPFMGMSPEARRRITALIVHIPGGDAVPFLGASLAALLHGLPALTHLSMPDCMPPVGEPYQQQQFVDALASLPDLEDLELKVSPVLDLLGCLAAPCRNLRALTLTDARSSCQLNARMMGGVSRLSQLQELIASVDTSSPDAFRTLLGNLPPSLRVLRVESSHLLDPLLGRAHPAFRFESGHLVELEVNVCIASSFLYFVSAVLMTSGDEDSGGSGGYGGSGGSGGATVPLQRLRRLCLEQVRVGAEDGDYWLQGPQAERASQLLRRCPAEVGRMVVDPNTPSRDVLRAIEVLGGALPRKVSLGSKVCPSFTLVLRPSGTGAASAAPPPPPAAATQPATSESPPAPCPPPPPLPDAGAAAPVSKNQLPRRRSLADLALNWLCAFSGQPADSSERNAAIPQREFDDRQVLLRGPLLAGLAWAPKALSAWVEQLKERATAAAAASAGGEGKIKLECLALPGAHAVLVRSNLSAAAAAVRNAARAAAAEARAAAAGARAAAGRSGGAVCQLRVLGVARAQPGQRLTASKTLSIALQEAAQHAYDGGLGCFAGSSELQRLQWVLEEWERLQVLKMD